MSLGLIVAGSPSTPSIITSALPPVPIEVVPRMLIAGAWIGLPSCGRMLTLASIPWSATVRFGTGRRRELLDVHLVHRAGEIPPLRGAVSDDDDLVERQRRARQRQVHGDLAAARDRRLRLAHHIANALRHDRDRAGGNVGEDEPSLFVGGRADGQSLHSHLYRRDRRRRLLVGDRTGDPALLRLGVADGHRQQHRQRGAEETEVFALKMWEACSSDGECRPTAVMSERNVGWRFISTDRAKVSSTSRNGDEHRCKTPDCFGHERRWHRSGSPLRCFGLGSFPICFVRAGATTP